MPGGGGPWLRRSASAQSASLVGDGSPLFASRARRQLLSLAAAALQLARRRPGTHSQIARACRRRHALPNGMNRRRCRARHAEFRFQVGRRWCFNSPGGSPPRGMQHAGLYPSPAVVSHPATLPGSGLSESGPMWVEVGASAPYAANASKHSCVCVCVCSCMRVCRFLFFAVPAVVSSVCVLVSVSQL